MVMMDKMLKDWSCNKHDLSFTKGIQLMWIIILKSSGETKQTPTVVSTEDWRGEKGEDR